MEGTYHNIMAVYDKHTANIILKEGHLKVFPPKSETIQECSLSSLLFNILPDVLLEELGKMKGLKASGLKRKK